MWKPGGGTILDQCFDQTRLNQHIAFAPGAPNVVYTFPSSTGTRWLCTPPLPSLQYLSKWTLAPSTLRPTWHFNSACLCLQLIMVSSVRTPILSWGRIYLWYITRLPLLAIGITREGVSQRDKENVSRESERLALEAIPDFR